MTSASENVVFETPEAPNEWGFYRYSGGSQEMIFLLAPGFRPGSFAPHPQWWVIFSNGTMEKCHWLYVAQALSVWDLVKIESDPKERNQE